MGNWTLTHGTDTRSLVGWGMTGASIQLNSFNAGIFSATILGDMTAALPWSYKDTVVVKQNGVTVFRGTVMPMSRDVDGPIEGIKFSAVDPWWWMGQGIFTQAHWDAATESAYNAARAALFASINVGVGWTARTIGEEITAIIAHCNALHGGGKMTLGTLSGDGFDLKPVPQRITDATHEAALRAVLKWIPDAVPSWDHSTNPPTLNIAQRASATAHSIAFCDGRVMMSQQIERKDDLVATGINIIYKGVDSLGNPTTFQDQAGATSGSGVLSTVVDMTGGSGGSSGNDTPTMTEIPEVKQDFHVESAPIDLADKNWWYQVADLGVDTADDILEITGAVMVVDPTTGHSDLGACVLQWISGEIPKSAANAHTRMAWIRALLRLRLTKTTSDSVTFEQAERRWVQLLVPTTSYSTGDRDIQTRPGSTSASTDISGFMGAAPTAAGIAAQLLAIWGQAQYAGGLRLTDEDCHTEISLGDVVNVIGGRTEWETMRSAVHQIQHDIDNGTTQIKLGIAEHLGLDEFASLIKIMRVATAPDVGRQATGASSPGDGDPIEMQAMVAPPTILCSVGRLIDSWVRATTTVKFEWKGDEAKSIQTNLSTDDQVTTEPASVTVENTSSADKTEVVPAKTTHTNSDAETNEQTPKGIKLTDASGDSLEIDLSVGVRIIKSGITTQLHPDGKLTISDGTATTTVSLLQLLHNDGAGKTTSVTEEQVVISGSGKLGIFQADSVSVSSGDDSASVDTADGLRVSTGGDALVAKPSMIVMTPADTDFYLGINPGFGMIIQTPGHGANYAAEQAIVHDGTALDIGDNFAKMAYATGFEVTDSGYQGKLHPSSGLHLENSGGDTVDAAPISGEAISLQSTDVCDTDGSGEPVEKTAYVLRGLAS